MKSRTITGIVHIEARSLLVLLLTVAFAFCFLACGGGGGSKGGTGDGSDLFGNSNGKLAGPGSELLNLYIPKTSTEDIYRHLGGSRPVMVASIPISFSLGGGKISIDMSKPLRKYATGDTSITLADYDYMYAVEQFITDADINTTINTLGYVNIGFANVMMRNNHLNDATNDGLILKVRVAGFDGATYTTTTLPIFMMDPNGSSGPSGWESTTGSDFTDFVQIGDSDTACPSSGNMQINAICDTSTDCSTLAKTTTLKQNLEFMIDANVPADTYAGEIYFEICNGTSVHDVDQADPTP